MRFLFCRVYIDLIILYFFTLAMVHMEMLVTFPKKWLYFSSPTSNVKLFYKNRYKIIFVKMGLGSGQQHFGKSNNIVLILMPDYLFTSQSESIFFLANQRTGYLLRMRDKKRSPPQKTKGSIP